jgi:hypothetical protein
MDTLYEWMGGKCHNTSANVCSRIGMLQIINYCFPHFSHPKHHYKLRWCIRPLLGGKHLKHDYLPYKPPMIASQCYTSFPMNSFKSNLLSIVAFWGVLIWQLPLFFLSLCVMLIFPVQFQMKIKLNTFSFKNKLFHLHVFFLISCSCTGLTLANKT